MYVIAFSKSVSFDTFILYIHLKQAELLTDPESQMKCQTEDTDNSSKFHFNPELL